MKTGLFYGTGTEKTTFVANKIRKAFGEDQIDIIPIESAWKRDFEAYDHIIAGTSTWFDGELPTYWDEIIPELVTLDLKNKKVAIFGLGDQTNYPDNFADAVGTGRPGGRIGKCPTRVAQFHREGGNTCRMYFVRIVGIANGSSFE